MSDAIQEIREQVRVSPKWGTYDKDKLIALLAHIDKLKVENQRLVALENKLATKSIQLHQLTERVELLERQKKSLSVALHAECPYNDLKAKKQRLREALEEIRDKSEYEWATCDGSPPSDVQDCIDIAAEALEADDE
jgi:hypothetical protein